MQIPPEISFRGVPTTDRLKGRVQDEVDKLERYFDGIIRCRVAVELPHRRHEDGNLYHVGIRVTVPGRELVVSHDPGRNEAHEELEVTLTHAFQAMARQLEEYSRQIRHEVKSHQVPPHGEIRKLFPYEDYGFIRTPDGRDVYFHRNAVADGDFEELELGMDVRFAETEGVEGPQATVVHVLGKRALPPVDTMR